MFFILPPNNVSVLLCIEGFGSGSKGSVVSVITVHRNQIILNLSSASAAQTSLCGAVLYVVSDARFVHRFTLSPKKYILEIDYFFCIVQMMYDNNCCISLRIILLNCKPI